MTPAELDELRILLIRAGGRAVRSSSVRERSVMMACVGKSKFDSHNHAMQSIKREKRGVVGAYRCVHCGAWHLGSRSNKQHRRGR